MVPGIYRAGISIFHSTAYQINIFFIKSYLYTTLSTVLSRKDSVLSSPYEIAPHINIFFENLTFVKNSSFNFSPSSRLTHVILISSRKNHDSSEKTNISNYLSFLSLYAKSNCLCLFSSLMENYKHDLGEPADQHHLKTFFMMETETLCGLSFSSSTICGTD